MKNIILINLFVLIGFAGSYAQNSPITQTIRGLVLDKETQQPLIGATVFVKDSDPVISSSTDIDGVYELTGVPVGRQILVANYLGYQTFESDGIIVDVAKAPYVELAMVEASNAAFSDSTMVVVKANRNGGGNGALNELAVVSARSFSAEQTQRYAGSIDDPSRMAMAFPGVQANQDSEADIVIRGNSAMGMSWKLEGLDISNTNHFAHPGSSGGGISALSVAVLGLSDFATGAFAAEYGDAYSGVFDLHFRKGNPNNYDFMARIGMIGLDFAAEGPIKKGKSSFLFNYRYSTLGIMNLFGLYVVRDNVSNAFQDLSFNVSFNSKNNKHIVKIFGLGGLASEQWYVKDTSKWVTRLDYVRKNLKTGLGVFGVNYTCLLDENSFLRVVAGGHINQIYDNDNDASLAISEMDSAQIINYLDTLNTVKLSSGNSTWDSTRIATNEYIYGRGSLQMTYSRKINNQFRIKAGLSGHAIFYNLTKGFRYSDALLLNKEKGVTPFINAYLQTSYRPVEKLMLNVGVYASFLALNNSYSVEPRFSLRYQAGKNTTITAAYGLHARMLPIGVYLLNINGSQPNMNLKMAKSHHAVLGFEQIIAGMIRLSVEGYYQRLFDLPVSADSNDVTYWFYNERYGYGNRAMVSQGKGQNFGVDITLEKAFDKGYFILLAGSVFSSTYQTPYSNEWRSTRMDSRYAVSLMGGKEFTFKKGGVLQLGLKTFLNGGMRYTPADTTASALAGTLVLDETQAFESRYAKDKNGLYYRMDLRFAYRKSHKKKKFSYTLALDIQNVLNAKNIHEYLYDVKENTMVPRYHGGILPVISARFDF